MRMWTIREGGEGRYGKGYRHEEKSLEEAYECGYEDGFEDAMEKFEEDDYRMGKRSMRSYKRSMR